MYTCRFREIKHGKYLVVLTWWRHQMETFSALLALCAGNSPVPVNSPHKGQWRGALMFTLICARINDWVNTREAGDLRRHLDHYDVIVMNYKVNNDLLDFDIRLIRYAANFIQKSSAQLIKDSLLHGRVHMDWKRARVSPVYKGGGLDSKAIIDQFLSLDILLNILLIPGVLSNYSVPGKSWFHIPWLICISQMKFYPNQLTQSNLLLAWKHR